MTDCALSSLVPQAYCFLDMHASLARLAVRFDIPILSTPVDLHAVFSATTGLWSTDKVQLYITESTARVFPTLESTLHWVGENIRGEFRVEVTS